MDVYNAPPPHSGVRQLILFYAKNNATLAKASRPGAFNDYDMLLAGNAGMRLGPDPDSAPRARPSASVQNGVCAPFSLLSTVPQYV